MNFVFVERLIVSAAMILIMSCLVSKLHWQLDSVGNSAVSRPITISLCYDQRQHSMTIMMMLLMMLVITALLIGQRALAQSNDTETIADAILLIVCPSVCMLQTIRCCAHGFGSMVINSSKLHMYNNIAKYLNFSSSSSLL